MKSFVAWARSWPEKYGPSRSLLGELTCLSILLAAIGLMLIFAIGAAARRSTAENLADFKMLDFLRVEIARKLEECGNVRRCVNDVVQNETGGVWRLPKKAGGVERSITYDLVGFGATLDVCVKSDVKRVAGARIFLCALPDDVVYRVATRRDGAVVALDVAEWRERMDLAANNLAASRSMRFAVVAMALTLAAFLSVILFVLRRRFRRLFAGLAAELDAFRRGDQDRIRGGYPREIQGLVASFNAALEKNAALVGRQRRNVNKMAHDLRHQIVNIDLATRGEGRAVQQELDTLGQLVERYLMLVDWIGPSEGVKPLPVKPLVDGVKRAFSRRLRVDPLEISVDCPEDLAARIHPTDLKIILNNLMTNAHRFAASRIRISASRVGEGGVSLAVEDDGPGVPEADRDKALGWGATLDHGAPGSGFGLAIVAEQVGELYGGRMRLERSDLGGLKVVVALPPPADAEFFAPWERETAPAPADG